jgi:hypothetical protein
MSSKVHGHFKLSLSLSHPFLSLRDGQQQPKTLSGKIYMLGGIKRWGEM